MRRLRRTSSVTLVVGLASFLVPFGCDPGPQTTRVHPTTSPTPLAAPLQIAAASDLRHVLPILAKQFTARSKIELNLSFGASGQLAEQIQAGAPFDVFLSANRSFIQNLADTGLIRPDSVHTYALGSLVLVVHGASGSAVRSLVDLEKPEIKKIALANPETAPYGAAGKQTLERSGLWTKLASKIVQAASVGQALQFVETGNAEAGLAGRSIANLPGLHVIEVDSHLYDPIVQGLGIVVRSKRPEDARKFTEFVLGSEGQSILSEAGFAPPRSEADIQNESRQ